VIRCAPKPDIPAQDDKNGLVVAATSGEKPEFPRETRAPDDRRRTAASRGVTQRFSGTDEFAGPGRSRETGDPGQDGDNGPSGADGQDGKPATDG
jgi:hypothetical protein